MSITEALGVILLTLFVVAAAAIGINSAFSKIKLSSTEQDIITMRMQIQQLFDGTTDYGGLDNATAIKTGVVPKRFIKGSELKNAWGGNVTVSSNSAAASFSVEFDNVPQDECTQLAKFQPDAWLSVSVNGNTLAKGSNVIDIVSNCATTNTIAYEAR